MRAYQLISLRVIAVLAGTALSILLSRNLQIEDFGRYLFLVRAVDLMMVGLIFGGDKLVIKEKAYSDLSSESITKPTVFISFLPMFISYILYSFGIVEIYWLIYIMNIPLIVFLRLKSAHLLSQDYLIRAFLADSFLLTFMAPLFLMLFIIFFPLNIISLVSIFLILNLLISLFFGFHREILSLGLNYNDLLLKFKEGFPFFVSTSFNLFQTSGVAVLVGIILSYDDLAYFSIVFRLSTVLLVLNQVANSIITPIFIRSLRENQKIDSIIRAHTRKFFFFGIIVTILISIFSKSILSLWGENYTNFSGGLILLLSAYLVNLLFGCAGVLLNYAGQENLLARITMLTSLGTLFSTYLLGSNFGVNGIFLGLALVLVIENIIKYVIVKNTLGIDIVFS